MTANDDQDDVYEVRDLAESQQIIRAYDTKAPILAAFLAGFVGALHLALTKHPSGFAVLCGQVAALSVLIGILLFGASV